VLKGLNLRRFRPQCRRPKLPRCVSHDQVRVIHCGQEANASKTFFAIKVKRTLRLRIRTLAVRSAAQVRSLGRYSQGRFLQLGPFSAIIPPMPLASEQLSGMVERVTYYSEETGYSVVRLDVPGQHDLVTVVGNLPEVQPGESLRLEGSWATHQLYGRQFKVERCEQVLPATVEGIKRYLGSGLVKGVGAVTAARIVQRFGADTLRVLDEQPRRLREALGVGKKRAAAIAEAWEEQKHIREVMVFLSSHGVTTGLAVKIYKTYGDDALNVVQEDPYRLARDIWGVGFKTADKIARDLGLPPDAPSRVQAGVAYALGQQADDGHVYAPEPDLTKEAAELLDVPAELVTDAIKALDDEEVVHREMLMYAPPPPAGRAEGGRAVREEQAVYLAPFYYGEIGVTNHLRALVESPATRLLRFRSVDWDNLLAQVTRDSEIELSPEQYEAVRAALAHKVTVLTGGPGTGKTVSVRTVIAALEAMGCRYALCAPTGRAAKRLGEATSRPAKTVHRLLEYSPMDGFRRNEENPLDVDCLIVDESSMLDLLLTNHLLKAVDPAAHVLFVGDIDQLPSVGAGDVLRDIIGSERAAVVRLNTIFRQAADSGIVVNAHRINRGEFPVLNEYGDFYFFSREDPEETADLLVDIVQRRIPDKFGFDPVDEVQVLAPMYRGACGVSNLNARLQEALNPASPQKAERRIGGRLYRVGDKVMQIRNDYLKDTFNGDIGRVIRIDPIEQTLTVTIDDRPVVYDWGETDELVHAFACSVHKSQGSEYPVVVVPMLTQHYLMLKRPILYTGVTRARSLVVLVGTRRAIAIAVRNNKVTQRHSGLGVRLAQ
jgi:exodeoxyribonuclease V alpha subunit